MTRRTGQTLTRPRSGGNVDRNHTLASQLHQTEPKPELLPVDFRPLRVQVKDDTRKVGFDVTFDVRLERIPFSWIQTSAEELGLELKDSADEQQGQGTFRFGLIPGIEVDDVGVQSGQLTVQGRLAYSTNPAA